jgi:hypothetical protein
MGVDKCKREWVSECVWKKKCLCATLRTLCYVMLCFLESQIQVNALWYVRDGVFFWLCVLVTVTHLCVLAFVWTGASHVLLAATCMVHMTWRVTESRHTWHSCGMHERPFGVYHSATCSDAVPSSHQDPHFRITCIISGRTERIESRFKGLLKNTARNKPALQWHVEDWCLLCMAWSLGRQPSLHFSLPFGGTQTARARGPNYPRGSKWRQRRRCIGGPVGVSYNNLEQMLDFLSSDCVAFPPNFVSKMVTSIQASSLQKPPDLPLWLRGAKS